MVAVGTDDVALTRVPREARDSWRSVAVQRFGQVSALSLFLLGSALGSGMGFWEAFWALTLGAVILEIVAIFVGIMGCRAGCRPPCWFGIQSAASAAGLVSLVGVLPTWGWSLAFGLAVTMVVLWGFGSTFRRRSTKPATRLASRAWLSCGTTRVGRSPTPRSGSYTRPPS